MRGFSEKCEPRKIITLSVEVIKPQNLWGNNIFLFFSHKLPNPLMSTGMEIK